MADHTNHPGCGMPHLPRVWSRRDLLMRAGNGFGALALATMLAEEARAAPKAVNPLAPRPAPQPHLESANSPLAAWETKPDRVAGEFTPTVPPRVVLAGFKAGQAVIVTGDFKGPAHADADGKLAVWAPLGPAKLEVRW